MAISKALRFEVLRRDNHACRYCGAAAPDVKLTVDHVVPVALGGTDVPQNLVTACQPCNSGKGAASPDAAVLANVAEDALRWRRAMEIANRMAVEEAETRDAYRDAFIEAWNDWTYVVPNYRSGTGKTETRHFELPGTWLVSVESLRAAGLSLADMQYAVDVALGGKFVKDEFSYFCGVAWKKVSERQEAARALIDEGLV